MCELVIIAPFAKLPLITSVILGTSINQRPPANLTHAPATNTLAMGKLEEKLAKDENPLIKIQIVFDLFKVKFFAQMRVMLKGTLPAGREMSKRW